MVLTVSIALLHVYTMTKHHYHSSMEQNDGIPPLDVIIKIYKKETDVRGSKHCQVTEVSSLK